MIDKILDILYKEYCFRKESEKETVLSALETTNSLSIVNEIRRLDDNHTHLLNTRKKQANAIFWLSGIPYLIEIDSKHQYMKKIDRVDNLLVDDLLDSFRNKYPHISQMNIESYMHQDYFQTLEKIETSDIYELRPDHCKKIVSIYEFSLGLKIITNTFYVVIRIFHFNHYDIVKKINNVLMNLDIGKTIILDLRNCTGGNVVTATKVTELFLSEEIELPYLISNHEVQYKRIIQGKSKIRHRPLVVFIGKQTLSSAEFILFHSLQLEGKCVSYGEKTSGHSGQARIKILNEDYSFSYTVRRYLVDGKEVVEGLTPDFIFTPTIYDVAAQKDILMDKFS